ncbi:MAG: MFS transporter [Victivallaceae bacterium]|nr:MFS transporter [Victivallaceae bacterium]
MKRIDSRKSAVFAFIVLMGVVSMFSDMTHEGAASIIGAYLSLAGASAGMIGFITGLGGLIGYSLRIVTGVLADKTRNYWLITIAGYLVDCIAIPLLALVPQGGWIWACALIVIQRIGKAVKKPAKDTLLSFAASEYGAGKSFAIQELLDQIGAFVGPMVLFGVLTWKRGGDLFGAYKLCLAILGIPALITIFLLFYARRKFPNPENFEPETKSSEGSIGKNSAFLYYMAGICFFAFGFIGFPLITMHAMKTGLISETAIPLIYAAAMLVDAFAALFFGWLYDRFGLNVLMLSTLLAAPFAWLVFAVPSSGWLWIGVALWGIGMGAQESILKAAVVTIISKEKRSTGYGVFQTGFGIAFFFGSWAMGVLYPISIFTMAALSCGMQLAAIPFFHLAARKCRSDREKEQPDGYVA